MDLAIKAKLTAKQASKKPSQPKLQPVASRNRFSSLQSEPAPIEFVSPTPTKKDKKPKAPKKTTSPPSPTIEPVIPTPVTPTHDEEPSSSTSWHPKLIPAQRSTESDPDYIAMLFNKIFVEADSVGPQTVELFDEIQATISKHLEVQTTIDGRQIAHVPFKADSKSKPETDKLYAILRKDPLAAFIFTAPGKDCFRYLTPTRHNPPTLVPTTFSYPVERDLSSNRVSSLRTALQSRLSLTSVMTFVLAVPRASSFC
jgi:hypothetical protein